MKINRLKQSFRKWQLLKGKEKSYRDIKIALRKSGKFKGNQERLKEIG
jgi:hypothetical protein